MWNENLAFVPKPYSFKHSENVYVLPFKISIQRDLRKHLRIKIDHHYNLKIKHSLNLFENKSRKCKSRICVMLCWTTYIFLDVPNEMSVPY